MNACNMPAVDFFTVSKYEYKNANICDFSNIPRPHFCLALILDGEADFIPTDGADTSPVHVKRGDLIFVPIASRYISKWSGDPDIRYISYHYSFIPGTGISERNNFLLQRVVPADFEAAKLDFETAYRDYCGNTVARLSVLARFYTLLSAILPCLSYSPRKKYDGRIEKAVEYIRLHSDEDISVPRLATLCNISTSHFYTKFKEEVGMTPVDYKNSILVGRATRMLLYDRDASIEAIADALGFASATYFRRVFKKTTGKSPSEYRRSAEEL